MFSFFLFKQKEKEKKEIGAKIYKDIIKELTMIDDHSHVTLVDNTVIYLWKKAKRKGSLK